MTEVTTWHRHLTFGLKKHYAIAVFINIFVIESRLSSTQHYG